MKRLKSKSGFTLVECVVAMAVLAIMTVGLLMILGVTVRTRNSNTQLEREVDRQVQDIVQGDNVTTEAYKDPISFKDEAGNDVGEIPGNGGGVKADKKYQENEDVDVEVGRLDYDFKDMTASPSPGGDGGNKDGKISQAGNFKVYGAADLSGGTVKIKEAAKVTTSDPYKITWEITFNPLSLADERGIKIVFPSGASQITCTTNTQNCDVRSIATYTQRILPSQTGTNSVTFTFLMPKDDCEEDPSLEKQTARYLSLSEYFKNVKTGSNEVIVTINTEYDEHGNAVVPKEG